jgi:hypothetical protein
MSTTWTIEIDWDRNGNFTGTYDDVTDRTVFAEWFVGARQPYQDDADDSMVTLMLTNHDKRFSPENDSSPLDGKLAPFRPVRIQSDDGTTTRTHWTGWIESIKPDVNQYQKRQVKITAAGPMQFFKGAETNLVLQENKRSDQIIQELIEEVEIPAPLNKTTLLGITGYCELDQNAYLPDLTIDYTLNTGLTTLAVAADNWISRDNQGEDTFNVYRAISDVVAAERGRFLFDRSGQAVFWNRHKLLLDTDVKATFDDTMTCLSYNFAGPGEFKNEISVTCHPRTVGAGSNDLLWQLDEPVTIAAGQIREIGASYRDDSENRIGGKDISLSNVTFSEGVASTHLEAGATRSKITIHNQGTVNAVLATCEVRGTKITDFGRMDAAAVDNESIAYYGRRTMNMNLQSIDNLDYAQTIADFELGRRSTPSGKVASMDLKSHGINGGDQHAEQLARTLGERINIKETQTAHDADYYIIGEAHKLSEGATLLETTWYLEGATAGSAWMVLAQDTDSEADYYNCNKLDGTYHLVY